jgi:radical SAM protein with 4Fe4S-binding SPASM domain
VKSRLLEQVVDQHAVRAAADRRPESVMFELTYACNLRCVHCSNPTHRALPSELATAEVCDIVRQIAEMGVLTVAFTGGEPTVRPDLPDILRYAQRQGLLLQLLTNATHLTPQFLDFLEGLPLTALNVSIYGASAATYEAMTAQPGSFTRFCHGLDLLASRTLPVTLRMPVTTVNMEEITACRSFAESRGMKFQYSLDITPRTDGNVDPLAYRLDGARKAAVDLMMLGDGLAFRSPDTCQPDQLFIACACGRSRFAVTPYGEMNLCVGFPIPRYNLRTGTVREGWNVLKQAVDEAIPNRHHECPACEVRRFCRQGRADAWLETGDMSRCLPHFKQWAQELEATHALLDPRRPD